MGTVIKNGKQKLIIICCALALISALPCHPEVYAANSGPKTDGKWIIVIDPGHGGRDPGALGAISKEKNINLAIALKTGNYLKENLKDITVIYTRDDDSTVDLIERPQIANRNNADLFISIHSNWAKSKSVAGAETFVMGHTRDEANLEVAMKENEVILLEEDYSTKYAGFDPKSPESYIMFTLMQNVFLEQSTDLAAKIQHQFNTRVERRDRGVKQAGFWVLYNTTMPAVLIETGFMTNAEEERYLNSEKGQDYIASAIFRACREYMNEIDIKSGISTVRESAQSVSQTQAAQASPDQAVFMVQVATASARKEVKPENFRGIKDIVELQVQERFKYATGSFTEYSDAVRYRKEIESLYPDAFVIAVRDNKILPLQQVLEQKKKKQN